MASIRFSPVIGAAAGSIGGLVISSGRGGPTVKSRPRPTNPASLSQAYAQAYFEQVHRAWTALSAANRLTWTTAALSATKTNRVGLTRPRSARELYFSVALPMAYAQIPLPGAYARPIYAQPYTTVRAVAIAADQIYISLDAAAVVAGQAISIYGGRTFSAATSGPTPRLRHLLSTVYTRCYLDVRAAFIAHFGQPAIGERLAFRVVHWKPMGTARSIWDLTTTVLNRGPDHVNNGTFEGSWTGQVPSPWTAPVIYTPSRDQSNPLQAANSWTLSVGDNVATAYTAAYLLTGLTSGRSYEFRCLLAMASGTFNSLKLYDNATTIHTLIAAPTAPSQREIIHTIPALTWVNPVYLWLTNAPHAPGSFTLDNLSIREIL
jgi:hypothetical protein